MKIDNSQQIERDEENKQIIEDNKQQSLRRMSSSIQFTGFEIRIEDLITWIPKSKKEEEENTQVILKGISTNIKKGKMTAIIGPSGSGKTTFMNYLAGRQNESQQFRNYAHYYLNNNEISDISKYKNIIGYVLQEDLIEARLTPREVFRFYAKMRTNKNQKNLTKNDIEEKVDDLIDLLGLQDCADTIVGDEFIRGISGGQKKRVNIGIELIQNPNLLFLDEPTTGLDSTTALNIMQTIEKLKRRGITIICTLHSPSTKIMELFDKVIILCQGNMVYDGKPQEIKDRLQELQFEPQGQPPLEYFLQIIDKDDLKIQLLNEKNKMEFGDVDEAKQFEDEVQKRYKERIDEFTEIQMQKTKEEIDDIKQLEKQNDAEQIENLDIVAKEKNQQRNVFYQFGALFWKSFKLQLLDYKGNLLRIFIILLNAATVLVTFLDLGDIEDGAIQAYQNRGGFIAMVLINLSFLGLNISSTIFIPLKRIFQKDQQARVYGKIPFFFSTIFNIYPFYLLVVFVEVTLFYYLSDLNKQSGEIYFWYLLFNLLIGFVNGTVLGILVGVIVAKRDDVPQVLPLMILPLFIVSGFFAQVKSMTWPLVILSYISPTKFAFQGQVLNEFRNSEEYMSDKACKLPKQAKQQCNPLSFYDFYEKEIWKNALFGIILFLVFLMISITVFMLKYREKKAKMENNDTMIKKYAKINQTPLENI